MRWPGQRTAARIAVAVLWAGAAAGGVGAVTRYKSSAGEPASAPERWPEGTAIHPAASGWTLVMVAHPMCPCTRSSLRELAKLMARLRGTLEARVLFIRPEGTGESWASSEAWSLARRIPGVEVDADPGSREANRFGAATSGQALLYDPQGRLRFAGGITIARAHEGDNPGSQRIAALVEGRPAERDTAPVFGCPLADPEGGP